MSSDDPIVRGNSEIFVPGDNQKYWMTSCQTPVFWFVRTIHRTLRGTVIKNVNVNRKSSQIKAGKCLLNSQLKDASLHIENSFTSIVQGKKTYCSGFQNERDVRSSDAKGRLVVFLLKEERRVGIKGTYEGLFLNGRKVNLLAENEDKEVQNICGYRQGLSGLS